MCHDQNSLPRLIVKWNLSVFSFHSSSLPHVLFSSLIMLPCANTFLTPVYCSARQKTMSFSVNPLFSQFIASLAGMMKLSQCYLCTRSPYHWHALAIGFRLLWQPSDRHLRRLLGLLGDTSPALQGITTTKTTPPTADIPKLPLGETESQRERA